MTVSFQQLEKIALYVDEKVENFRIKNRGGSYNW